MTNALNQIYKRIKNMKDDLIFLTEFTVIVVLMSILFLYLTSP